jgi:DNA-binding NarL/FixJ family response regulator
VQQQLALAVLSLSDAVPALLTDDEMPPQIVLLDLPMPDGARLRFTATLAVLP